MLCLAWLYINHRNLPSRNLTYHSFLYPGLPHDLNSKQLEEKVAPYGPIKALRFIQHAEKYQTCSALVSFHEMDSALAVMDEWQHTVLFGRRVEITFNRFSTVGRQWSNNEAVVTVHRRDSSGDGVEASDQHQQRS